MDVLINNITASQNEAKSLHGCISLEENKGQILINNTNLYENKAGDSSGALSIIKVILIIFQKNQKCQKIIFFLI